MLLSCDGEELLRLVLRRCQVGLGRAKVGVALALLLVEARNVSAQTTYYCGGAGGLGGGSDSALGRLCLRGGDLARSQGLQGGHLASSRGFHAVDFLVFGRLARSYFRHLPRHLVFEGGELLIEGARHNCIFIRQLLLPTVHLLLRVGLRTLQLSLLREQRLRHDHLLLLVFFYPRLALLRHGRQLRELGTAVRQIRLVALQACRRLTRQVLLRQCLLTLQRHLLLRPKPLHLGTEAQSKLQGLFQKALGFGLSAQDSRA
jgi:hypothetical protein